jgi:hypothetical protein
LSFQAAAHNPDWRACGRASDRGSPDG